MLRHFIQLVKPGIIFGNLISTLGGFFLATKGEFQFPLLVWAVLGVSLVIASGCVFNNCIDRDIDANMARTKNRAMVNSIILMPVALCYGVLLGICGVTILFWFANILSAILAVIGFIIYVGLYSMYFKRHSVHGTLIGSFSGAMPPVIGYCSVSGQFDAAAWILLIMFSLWQMPHAFAIAIFRLDDYTLSRIPVLPVKRGLESTKRQMFIYVILFTIAASMLTVLGYTGLAYLLSTLILGIIWGVMIFSSSSRHDTKQWARKQFLFSVVIVCILSFMMSIDTH